MLFTNDLEAIEISTYQMKVAFFSNICDYICVFYEF